MAQRFVNMDWNTPMLPPADLRQWLPDDHIAHFLIEALESLNPDSAKVNHRASGDKQFPETPAWPGH
ncbi:MAG: hypothetical protein RLZZ399_771 [Verrucomicrobiota bacterium]|jgi:hypothetical protein